MGETGTGAKTNLINRLLGIKYDELSASTSVCSFSNIQINLGKKKKPIFHLWDTIGQEKLRNLSKLYFNYLDCAIIGYDITNKHTYDEAINYWYPTVKNYKTCKLIYLIGNKIDNYMNEQVSSDKATEFTQKENLKFFGISC